MTAQHTAAAAGGTLDEQRQLVRKARVELLQRHRGGQEGGTEPPIRVMARIVEDLQRECAERGFDPAATRLEIVNRTIGDVNVRLITECEGEEGGSGDYRMLGDELGIALPGEDIGGYTASGTCYRWLRGQMLDAERQLLAVGYDPRIYDIHGVGNPVLRDWLAADMREWGLEATAQQVALGLGATDCIDNVLRGLAHLAQRHGEPVGAMLFPAPGFNIPELQGASYGYRLHPVQTRAEDDFKLTDTLLARHLEEHPDVTAIYLTVTNNPTTFAYSPAELSAFQQVVERFVAQGRRLHVIADLAYVGTGVPEEDRARMRALTSRPKTAGAMIYANSFSKTHTLTGERFGWVVFGDAAFARAMGSSWTNSVGSLPGEWQLRFMAYHRLFRQNPHLLEKIRELYRLRRSRLRRQLERFDAEHGLFERIYLDDDATIYNWSKLRPGEDCFSVLEKTGLAGIPGSTFGYSDDYVRFSVGILPVETE
ncbi:pyridoxal phosphate-dependent aminotransferase [Streptomyces reniochalinae]|uniref:Pyridoxal phosphate-dependent aminotransferase n=1 Tax=Streptomyces reniochalinae TaxID=2250578 RepID=A0A367EJ33_9ACTN|nr:pyridoxal phosphate-dependent aminotransferase [Streptomyces reniochalinae]RCG17645.1 pyridoxal phosphate-dependent aminotransferase [Streptomyces reniochalinae]